MEHGVGGRPGQPHAAVPLSGRRSAGASVRPPRTPGSPSSAAHAGGGHRLPVPHARPASQQGPGRMSSTRRPRFRSGPPAKPGVCRPDAATTWRGPTAPMRWPTWAGLHSRMWRFPWTVPGPVDTSSRPGCANLLRLSAAHPRAPSSRLSARAVGAGATSCVQNLLQIRSWSRWSWALVGNAQRGPQGEGVNITPPCAGPPSCARADCPC